MIACSAMATACSAKAAAANRVRGGTRVSENGFGLK